MRQWLELYLYYAVLFLYLKCSLWDVKRSIYFWYTRAECEKVRKKIYLIVSCWYKYEKLLLRLFVHFVFRKLKSTPVCCRFQQKVSTWLLMSMTENILNKSYSLGKSATIVAQVWALHPNGTNIPFVQRGGLVGFSVLYNFLEICLFCGFLF